MGLPACPGQANMGVPDVEAEFASIVANLSQETHELMPQLSTCWTKDVSALPFLRLHGILLCVIFADPGWLHAVCCVHMKLVMRSRRAAEQEVIGK